MGAKDLAGVVVVGTDGTASAVAALREAAVVAATAGVDLHIVSAYERTGRAAQRRAARRLPTGLDLDHPGLGYAAARAAIEDAEEIAAGLGARTAGHVIEGAPADVLCAVARGVAGELIVVGNRGVASPLRHVRPPVCRRVAGQAACAVRIVDTSAHWPTRVRASRRDSPWA